MPAVIDATVGGTNSNSYCTLAEALAYHETHPYASVWDNATDDQRTRALITATRLLDDHFVWKGGAATYTQRLLWPRVGLWEKNNRTIQPTELPLALKNATAEFARELLAANRAADNDVETAGLTQLTAGPVSLTFKDTTAKVVPDAVLNMLSQWGSLRPGRKSGVVPLLRG